MEALIVLVLTFGLLWVFFILPQQRRVRAHQRLVVSLEEGDEVVLSAGIFGRISHLGPEQMRLEVAPGVELQVARQAVLRRVEYAVGAGDPDGSPAIADDAAEGAEGAGEAERPAGDDTGEAGGAIEPSEIDSEADGDNNADRPDGDRSTS